MEVVTKNRGVVCYYLDGMRHREDGPAIVHKAGVRQWWLNGMRHREDGPAVEWEDGTKEWWWRGKLYREGGPAIEWADGSKEWRLNNHLHREGGPAVERADGSREWWWNGIKMNEALVTLPEKPLRTDKECLVYHQVPIPGQRYMVCSFSDEHVFTLDGPTGFPRDKCMYCKNDLRQEIYTQPSP